MSKGKFESPPRRRRSGGKVTALLLSATLLIGCAVGGTLAWLLDKTDPVQNTFTPSDINITLTETDITDDQREKEFKMIPGHTIDKDPKVTVKAGSEACWLFLKVEESTDPALSDYIAYAIDTGDTAWTQGKGLHESNCDANCTAHDGVPTNVYYRQVSANDTEDQTFGVLVAGSYIYDNTTADDTSDDVTVTWGNNQVGVKPEVTKEMMEALKENGAAQPTLSFTAYATQLNKTNDTAFGVGEAWKIAYAQANSTTTPGSGT